MIMPVGNAIGMYGEPATPLNRLPISGTDITPRPAPNSWVVDDRTASLIRHVGGNIFPFPSRADPSHQSAGIARAASGCVELPALRLWEIGQARQLSPPIHTASICIAANDVVCVSGL
jgi:hypothetical protein